MASPAVDLSSDEQYAAWLRKVAEISALRELRMVFMELELIIFMRNKDHEERRLRCAVALFDRALEDDLTEEGRKLIADLHQRTIIVDLVRRRIDETEATQALREYLVKLFASGERATS